MEKQALKLAIVGKARVVPPEELAQYDEVWTVGTNPIEADVYYCLHGESSIHPERDLTWRDCIHIPVMYSLPVVNTICLMLACIASDIEVLHKRYQSIHILGSPLIASSEMREERPAVACWYGYLMGLGQSVYWEGGWKRKFPYMLNEYYSAKGDQG